MSQDGSAERYARKGKRKMNEDDAEPSIPSPVPTARHRASIQRLLNAAASMRPFTSGSILPAPEPPAAPMRPLSNSSFLPASEPASIPIQRSLPPTIGQQINQIVANNNQNMKDALYASVEKKAEEIGARMIHEKEMEIHAKNIENVKLEEELAQYKGQISRLLPHSRNWEKTVAHLQKKLREAKELFPNLAIREEDMAESSYVNTGKVDPVRLDCVVCKKFVANIMMWTCRHISVCSECNEVTDKCPVCGTVKLSYVEVCIPTYD